MESIAHYRITSKLGEGGMGEVYRATDTKLNREVAIKVIPESFAQDPDRMARFTREAQVLASLNHPNIAVIHGVEERAIVMELVEGETLSGPLSLEQALPIIQQLIDALEYAHEKGVVHRDLKPANIKITPEGRVKVLDFGLAKAMSGDVSGADPTSSPTLTMRATMAGMIMGTAAYMAPEQARGHNVDKRADIWAFGVVVYEILTGHQLFAGPTVSDTLASVLKEQPDWERVPSRLRKLLRLCLMKDPRKRLRDIGDARALIDEVTEAPIPNPQPPTPNSYLRIALALPVLAALVLGFLFWRATRPVLLPMMRFSTELGPGAVVGSRSTAAISPDGTRLVFSVRGTGGMTQFATRLLDQSKANILAGAENAEDPFFSPDGQWIGFSADGKLKKISVQGGAPVTLCDASALRGAAWGEDGNIIATLNNSAGLSRVPAAGGKPELLTKPEERGGRTHRWPQILPGGQMVLYTANTSGATGYEDSNIEVFSLKTGQTKIVQRGGYFGRYLPSGHLVYVHQSTLFGTPFDLSRLETRSTPAPLLEDVAGAVTFGAGQLDFSQNGTLIYLSGKASAAVWPLVWMDSTGKMQPLLTPSSPALTPRLSPDGKRLAISILGDISVYDMQRDAMTPISFTRALSRTPFWSPDGKHIAFSQGNLSGEYGIWWIRADGSGRPQRLLGTKEPLYASSFSPDGRRLAFFQRSNETLNDLWTLPLDTSDPERPKPGQPELFLREPAEQVDPAFSPDGRWLAYSSNESGSMQVFVRPFPGSPGGGRWQISTTAGMFPLWSRNGRELFYMSGIDARIMVAGYTVKDNSFVADKPRTWSPTPIPRTGILSSYDLAPDGKRFAVFQAPGDQQEDKGSVHVTVLVNFFDELRRRMP